MAKTPISLPAANLFRHLMTNHVPRRSLAFVVACRNSALRERRISNAAYNVTMAYFIPDSLASPRFQLIATAVLSSATAVCLLLGYQALDREERLSELKSSIPSLADGGHNLKKVPAAPLSAIYKS